jgi:predicted DNA-binding transcriptional regulator AlpA
MPRVKEWNVTPRKKPTVKVQAKKIAPPSPEVRLDDEILTTSEAAELTKMSAAWFERKRWEGHGGPPYHRRGRSVRYFKSELLSWWAESKL